MIEYVATLCIIIAGIGAIYYLKQRKPDGDYLWMGEGDDPFKKTDDN